MGTRITGLQDNKLGLTASLLAGGVAECLLPPRPPLKGWVVKVLSNPQAAGQPAKSRDLTSPYCSQRYIPSTGLHAMPALIDRNYRGKEMFIYFIVHLYPFEIVVCSHEATSGPQNIWSIPQFV